MKHQLIMENWRRFIKEDQELRMLLEAYDPNEQLLKEGIAEAALLILGLSAGAGQDEIKVAIDDFATEQVQDADTDGDGMMKVNGEEVSTDDVKTAIVKTIGFSIGSDKLDTGEALKIIDRAPDNNAGPNMDSWNFSGNLGSVIDYFMPDSPQSVTDTGGDQGGQVTGTQSNWGAKLGNLQNQIDSAVSLEQPEKLQKLQQDTASWDVPTDFQDQYQQLMQTLNSAL